jgi:hypothetical protein
MLFCSLVYVVILCLRYKYLVTGSEALVIWNRDQQGTSKQQSPRWPTGLPPRTFSRLCACLCSSRRTRRRRGRSTSGLSPRCSCSATPRLTSATTTTCEAAAVPKLTSHTTASTSPARRPLAGSAMASTRQTC